jgi:hypothetical protein
MYAEAASEAGQESAPRIIQSSCTVRQTRRSSAASPS